MRWRSARSSARGAAIASGYFAEEIIPVQVPAARPGTITVDLDEPPRPETTLEGLAKLNADRAQSGHGDRGQRMWASSTAPPR